MASCNPTMMSSQKDMKEPGVSTANTSLSTNLSQAISQAIINTFRRSLRGGVLGSRKDSSCDLYSNNYSYATRYSNARSTYNFCKGFALLQAQELQALALGLKGLA
jgi:hypothetical protein